jgi:hypothetical protein
MIQYKLENDMLGFWRIWTGGVSSPADTETTHTNPESGHLSLRSNIYDDNNPSEYGTSP